MAALAPEILTHIGPLPITNTLINTLTIDVLLVGSAIYLSKHVTKIPGAFQNIVESIVEIFYNFTESIAGKNTTKIFPWVFTFFIFILLSNWSGLLPGFGSIGFFENPKKVEVVANNKTQSDSHAVKDESPTKKKAHKEELVPIFRNSTSDANTTFALALISVVVTHVLSVQTLGWKEYLGRFFSLNPIFLFVGMLEIISEFTKIVSLSFRLFGNIYAGEVVLSTVNSLFAFVFPLPFMSLELIVGLVQALVFSILTMVFMSILMTPHHAEEEAHN